MTTTQRTPTTYDESGETIGPPHLPEGFLLRGEPTPLLSVRDERWIALVLDCISDSVGLLVYEDTRKVAFLCASEAVGMLVCLIQEGWTLLPDCNASLSPGHKRAGEYLRDLGWKEETRKAKAFLGMTLQEGEEELA